MWRDPGAGAVVVLVRHTVDVRVAVRVRGEVRRGGGRRRRRGRRRRGRRGQPGGSLFKKVDASEVISTFRKLDGNDTENSRSSPFDPTVLRSVAVENDSSLAILRL